MRLLHCTLALAAACLAGGICLGQGYGYENGRLAVGADGYAGRVRGSTHPAYQDGRGHAILFGDFFVPFFQQKDVFLFTGRPGAEETEAAYAPGPQTPQPPAGGGLSPEALKVIREDEREILGQGPAPDQAGLTAAVTPYLKAECARCHSAPGGRGRLVLFRNDRLQAKVDWAAVYRRASASNAEERMPPAPRPALAGGVLAQLKALAGQ